jgi:hypothetical protein
VNEHIRWKHKRFDVQAEQCQICPQVRPGAREGEDLNLKRMTAEATAKFQECGTWTKEQVETYGRQWKRELAQEWARDVKEKHISRSEAKYIRKDGSFLKFIKEIISPVWDQFKDAPFEAIQGLYERSIEMQLMKMRELRRDDREPYRPKKPLSQNRSKTG